MVSEIHQTVQKMAKERMRWKKTRAQSWLCYSYVVDYLEGSAMYDSKLFIWKFAHLLFFLSHQNLPALNLWCCSEKNPVFKSDKTDKWFKCCGLKSTALEITAPLSASIIHDDPLFGLKLRHKTTAELSHQ